MSCEVTPGMEFWYKLNGFTGTAVPDSSPHGRTLTLTAGSPTLSGDPIPGLVLTAATKLVGSTAAGQNFENGFTMFFVIKEASFNHGKILISKVDTADMFQGWDLGRFQLGSVQNFKCFHADYPNSSSYFNDDDEVYFWGGAFDSSIHVYTIEFYREIHQNQLRIVIRRDGTIIDTQVRTTDNEHSPHVFPAASNAGPLMIGSVYGASSGLACTLYEIIGYSSNLSSQNITNNENYFRNRFSVGGARRVYSTPFGEVGRVTYLDTYAGIAQHASTQAGDVIILLERYHTPDDAIDWANPVSGVLYGASGVNVGVPDTVNGGTMRFQWRYRVAQAAGETGTYKSLSGGALSPVYSHLLTLVTLRGLAVGGTGAPFQGNTIGAYGEVMQDFAYNFDWTGFQYQAPTTKIGPLFAAHRNSLFYKALLNDVGTPSITVSIVQQGSVAEFDYGGGSSWIGLGFLFESESTADIDDPVPDCQPGYRPDCNDINDSAL